METIENGAEILASIAGALGVRNSSQFLLKNFIDVKKDNKALSAMKKSSQFKAYMAALDQWIAANQRVLNAAKKIPQDFIEAWVGPQLKQCKNNVKVDKLGKKSIESSVQGLKDALYPDTGLDKALKDKNIEKKLIELRKEFDGLTGSASAIEYCYKALKSKHPIFEDVYLYSTAFPTKQQVEVGVQGRVRINAALEKVAGAKKQKK